MKLLFDENLSPRLVPLLSASFPESTHIRDIGLASANDDAVWTHAENHDFVIGSKDSDFHQRSFVKGSPPKESCGYAVEIVALRKSRNCSRGIDETSKDS